MTVKSYRMKKNMNVGVRCCVAFCVVVAAMIFSVLVVSSPARAGFEFFPPVKTQVTPTQDTNAPPQASKPMPMEPVEAMPLQAPSESMEREGPAKVDTLEKAASPYGQPIDVVPLRPLPEDNKKGKGGYDIVEGFGQDIPLYLALDQIVPPSYITRIASGIDPDTPLSWTGGKPWNTVLNNALNGTKLQADITGNIVHVRPHSILEHGMTASLPKRPSTPVVLQSGEMAGKRAPHITVHKHDTSGPADRRQDKVNGMTIVELNRPARLSAPIPRATMFAESPGMVMKPDEVRSWKASSGENLRLVMTRWADLAGVKIYWGAARNYTLPQEIAVEGTYVDALTRVFELYALSEPRPWGKLHPNIPRGPSVLIVHNYPSLEETYDIY